MPENPKPVIRTTDVEDYRAALLRAWEKKSDVVVVYEPRPVEKPTEVTTNGRTDA